MKLLHLEKKVWVLGAAVAALGGCAPKMPTKTPGVISFSDFVALERRTQAPETGDVRKPETTPKTTEEPEQPPCGKDCQNLKTEFRYVVYVGKQIYCYWPEKSAETHINFDAYAKTLEKFITDATTPTLYYSLLRQWAASLHDGHVNVVPKEDQSEIEVYTSGIRLENLASGTDHEKIAVVGIDPSLSGKGLKQGDEVVALDGVPVQHALNLAAEGSVSGSTRGMRRFAAVRRLVDGLGMGFGRPIELEVLRDGTTLRVQIPRTASLAPQPDGPGAPDVPSTGVENFKATVLPGGLGYLKISAFLGTQSVFLLNQAMRRLAHTRGLLIDLRNNGGGDQSGSAILAWLTEQKIARYRVSQKMDHFVLASRPSYFFLPWTPGAEFANWSPVSIVPGPERYMGPVVAIANPRCFSACDTFVSALKVHKLATIVGEPTGGGTGSPLIFDLPVSEHQFRYSVVRGLTANGDPIEGVGTIPDVVLEPTLADRATGTDSQLARALEILMTKVGAHPVEIPKEIISALNPSWKQRLDVAPTIAEDLELKKIAASDEL